MALTFSTTFRKFDSRNSPEIVTPRFIGEFSLDGKRKIHFDNRNLAHVKVDWNENRAKKVNYDLNLGYENVIHKEFQFKAKEKLDHLLRWMVDKNDAVVATSSSQAKSGMRRVVNKIGADFLCRRGVLQDIMCSPYSKDGWIIRATKFQGTIYLCEEPTAEDITSEKNMTERDKCMSSWGLKFEQYMTEGSKSSDPVNENEDYNCILRSQLGDHSLLYRAEVDGVVTDLYEPSPTNLSSYLELKTTKKLETDWEETKLKKFKMLKWWYQSHLAGIPKVVCGFRNDHGIVEEVKIFKVEDLPALCTNFWSDKVMLNCLNNFLTWVKKKVTEDDENQVYLFTKKKNDEVVTCRCLGERSSGKTFLPEWYTNTILQ